MIDGAIDVAEFVNEEVSQLIEKGLRDFYEQHNGPDPTKPIWVVFRNPDNTVVAGLQGFTI